MEEKDKEDDEEYKKRMKEFVSRVEKGKDVPADYQQFTESIESLKQIAISKIRPLYRNELSIFVFVYTIRDYYRRIADPKHLTEQDQIQKEIGYLYLLIYEELKKTSIQALSFAFENRRTLDAINRRRILRRIRGVWGEETYRQFYKNFRIRKLVSVNSNIYLRVTAMIAIVIISIFLMMVSQFFF